MPGISSTRTASGAGSPMPGIGTFTPFFLFLAYPNLILLSLVFYALWMPNFSSTPPLIISQTRYLFSWAWDRILPDSIAKVSDRFHTPLLACLIVILGSILGALIYDFFPSTGLSITVYPIFTFGFLIPALAAAVFPYIKRDFYNSAMLVRRKVAEVPIMTLLGILTAVYLVFSTYLAITSGSLPVNGGTGLTYLIIYGLGIGIYLAGYWNAKREGIPLELVFKQIPP